MVVSVYNRTFEPDNIEIIKSVFDQMTHYGLEMVLFQPFYDAIKNYYTFKSTIRTFSSRQDIPIETEAMISLGGDGTLLDVVTFVGGSRIPILGVNLGRLGFLAAISINGIEVAIQCLINNSFSIEKRSLLRLDSSAALFGDTPFALNEFTLHRKDASSMIKVHTYLNGEFLNTYWADGLIVATPTGSTGYSLSCGGPVVFPQTSNFVITPVAPHNLNTRPIIVPDNHIISFEIEGRADHFLCTLDSRTETITSDIQLAVRKEDFDIALIRPNDHNFLATLRQKLYWGLDRRN
jgi:NAD+ kinase